MATLKQIVEKSVEVKTAFDTVSGATLRRDSAQAELAAAQASLASAQANLQNLRDQLKTLINEP